MCGALVAGAAITDFLWRTIPNGFTMPAAFCGCLYLWLLMPGMEGLALSLEGLVIGGLLFFTTLRHGNGRRR